MKPTQIIFFIAMLLFFLGANYYVFYRIWRMLPPTPVAKIVVVVCGVALVSSFFLAMLGSRGGLPIGVATGLYRVGTAWIFIFLYLLIIFLVADLLRTTHLLPMERVMYSNPAVLGGITVFLALVFALGNINYHNKRKVELSVETSKTLDAPVRIVAVSDLHLGYGIGRRELSRWVDMINSEKPDIVLIAGDLVDTGTYSLERGGYAEELRRLDAKSGVWLAPGNHEYISGIDASLRFAKDAGINILRDSVALVGGVYIAGRDDRTNSGRLSVAGLMAECDPSLPSVLLDHQPYELDKSEAAGIDLQISGHTHRGQVWPVTWITDAMYERSHGGLRKGNTDFWISSGLGIWGGKFRIGSVSEYIVVEISGKKE